MNSLECWTFCDQILPEVSRSFALIIPQCPPPVDRALCVAYLICRLADTVEDEERLSPEQRSTLYDALLSAVERPADPAASEAFVRAWPSLPEGPYGRLAANTACVLSAYASLPPECLPPIRTCVQDMIAGMRITRPVELREGVSYLCADLPALDQYCHYVAGVVGIMSTALFEMRFDPAAFRATPAWREQGRRLGLGLQMTNIIKDCRVDAERGVSFIPPGFTEGGRWNYLLRPEGLTTLLRHTVGHLDQALGYVLAVPASETGIRTFLLGSMLPAIATLEVAATGREHQPKISRVTMGEIFTLIAEHAAEDETVSKWYNLHRSWTLQAT